MNACANVGRPTLAMLVPSEDSNMDSERPASAHRAEGLRSGSSATGSSLPAMIVVNMNSVSGGLSRAGFGGGRSVGRRSSYASSTAGSLRPSSASTVRHACWADK
ncbi:hypothetical protein GCM10017600_44590 [Streptosporangium carneum]|uniref:Uncharacterized protein n=1 Tax=Streptosporangium carneum TaxID=47481 RepID=A0A9W6MEP7_9ACTN|nr:hypothetical protein GCM10017600_44590 [Streptosporangium carneum]